MEKYNGWTNYATWRVNLEIFDGVPFIDDFEGDTLALAEFLKELAEEHLRENANGLALDYALAFIDDVNWLEIAESMEELEGA